MTHYGGLEYRHELLWRVWREWPETEGGELAFLQLLGSGWNTVPGEGCPKNPDLFREVIIRAEAFLASHPRTDFRKQVLYALAQANESWWSIAHAPKDDEWVNAPPFPRRAANAQQASRARDEALRYYRRGGASCAGQSRGRQRTAPAAAAGTGPGYRAAPFLLFVLLTADARVTSEIRLTPYPSMRANLFVVLALVLPAVCQTLPPGVQKRPPSRASPSTRSPTACTCCCFPIRRIRR